MFKKRRKFKKVKRNRKVNKQQFKEQEEYAGDIWFPDRTKEQEEKRIETLSQNLNSQLDIAIFKD
jgi:hypothetical protein